MKVLKLKIKPHDIEVPADDPFKNDALDRKETVEIVARLVGSVRSPAVFGIDADWGNGKTTFIRMLQAFLKKEDIRTVSFNAWESDYVADPFTAIVTELTDALSEYADGSDAGTRKKIENGLERAKDIMKTRWPVIIKAFVGELPIAGKSLAEMIASVADSYVNNNVSAYRDSRKAAKDFKDTLQDIAMSVSSDPKLPLLVVTIDELDRCRPSYAVELLEVAKHLFSVEGVVFVIAVNQSELSHSVRALYGPEFDARGYLGRFFDVDFRLPDPDRSSFLRNTIASVGIKAYIDRTADADRRSEFDTLESMLTFFFGVPVVSLRAAARSICHLGMVYGALADDQLVLGTTAAVLIILRTIDRDLYYRFVSGKESDLDVVDAIVDKLGSHTHAEVAVFEAWVITSQLERDRGETFGALDPTDSPLFRRYDSMVKKSVNEDLSAETADQKHAEDVRFRLSVIHSDVRRYEGIKFNAVVQRIELLSPELAEQ